MTGRLAGIDVGGTFAKLVVVEKNGRVCEELSLPTHPADGPEAFLARLAPAIRAMGGVEAVGLAIAGLVDGERGVLRVSPNLAGWRDVPLAAMLKRRLRRPGAVANDANAAAWGLYVLESKRRAASLFAVTLGTGVGGGLVAGGRVFEGAFGSAGEIGHTVVVPGGDRCACGTRGCVEAYAGGRSIVRRYLEAAPRAPKGAVTPKTVADRAKAGDRRALKVWREAGRALGLAIHDLSCIVNPAEVVLTGGVSRSGRLLLPSLRSALRGIAFQGPHRGMKVRLSRHPNPGAVGAALLALEQAG